MRNRCTREVSMSRQVILAIAIVSLLKSQVVADCGAIPFDSGVLVFEPTQRAMIGQNGRAALLLLSQDVRGSKATRVLQVLPLPSEPKVTKGNFDVFVKATDLINK